VADLEKELGASRSFAVVATPHGPFGVAALLDEVKTRLISRGGRPSDPSPTVRRLVPLKTRVWRRLQTQAEHLSGLGKRVSPGQLAAMLLEKSVDELEHPPREKPPV
jgi:ubiquinone biosynthesis protein COQ9